MEAARWTKVVSEGSPSLRCMSLATRWLAVEWWVNRTVFLQWTCFGDVPCSCGQFQCFFISSCRSQTAWCAKYLYQSQDAWDKMFVYFYSRLKGLQHREFKHVIFIFEVLNVVLHRPRWMFLPHAVCDFIVSLLWRPHVIEYAINCSSL